MHEFSLVRKEVELLQSKVNGKRVNKVIFCLGGLAHGTPESIAQAFKIATVDTPLSEAELQIKIIEPKLKCSSCGNVFNVDKKPVFSCLACGSNLNEIISGQECSIDSVEVED